LAVVVVDRAGRVLAIFRRPAASGAEVEKALSLARTGAFFSSIGTPLSSRTVRAISRPNFPEGIPKTQPGPFADMYAADTASPCTQGHQPANQNQSGIVFFPGSAPLYRNGQLMGGLGVSGDGVEEDDYVTSGGAVSFLAPPASRADQVFIRGVRLPYWSFPRNPEQ
jgi:uncharacterized protein GlcG (DUF336 family)